jgi:hypothetical protein
MEFEFFVFVGIIKSLCPQFMSVNDKVKLYILYSTRNCTVHHGIIWGTVC